MDLSRLARLLIGRRSILLVAIVLAGPVFGETKFVPQAVVIRGASQRLFHLLAPDGQSRSRSPVLFIPGDGAWRGAAVDMGRLIGSLGLEVYGLDVRRYLSSYTNAQGTLTEEQLAFDIQQIAGQVMDGSQLPVILVGWSQGAAMAVLAAARAPNKAAIGGVVTIGLPESGVLGWSWRDSLLALAGRQAREPEFPTPPLLPAVAPIPLWLIFGSRDRFTPVAAARRLAALARRPKRHREIKDGNHSLSGHAKELMNSLHSALGWIESREAVRESVTPRSPPQPCPW